MKCAAVFFLSSQAAKTKAAEKDVKIEQVSEVNGRTQKAIRHFSHALDDMKFLLIEILI